MVYALSYFLVLLLSVSGSELLGKYEFWDHFGPFAYDYSENFRYGVIATPPNRPILTDRGIYIRNSLSIQFPNNRFSLFPVSYTDMVFSILLYPKLDNFCLFSFNISGMQIEICFTNIQESLLIELQGSISLSHQIHTELKTWKVFSIRLTQKTAGVYLSVYLDGEDTNIPLYMLITGAGFDENTSSWSFGTTSGSIEGFLYGIWWHGSISNTIKVLTRSIIGNTDDSCTTFYALEPWKQCLSNIDDPYTNSVGDSCNQDCISLTQSCRLDGSCIEGCTYKCITSSICRSPVYLSCPDSCPSACKNCISESDYCIKCEPGYTLSFDQAGVCILEVPNCLTLDSSYQCASCELGYYLTDYSPPTCEICPDGCLSCTISSGQITCNECQQGYFLQSPGSSPICTETCGIYGEDLNTVPNRCKQCGFQCYDCIYDYSTQIYDCTLCEAESPILFSNYCIASCPAYYYRVSNSCSPCPSYCTHCSDSSTCTQCGQGYYLNGSTCQPCMADYYDSNILIGNLLCILCNNQLCSKCRYGYYLTTNICIKCTILNCFDCEDSSVCNSCIDGYITIEQGSRCVPECKTDLHKLGDGSCALSSVNLYTVCAPNNDIECTHSSIDTNIIYSETVRCLVNCIFCFRDNGEYTCSICITGFYLTYDRIHCVSSCGDGYYQDTTTFECLPCSDSLCKNCNTNINECRECSDDNYLQPNNSGCLPNCPDQYFKDTVSGIKICTQCITNCKTCTSIVDCSECLSNYYLYNPTPTEYSCIEYCTIPYYGNYNFKCIRCPLNCEVCESEIRCMRCSVGYILNSDLLCVEFNCSPNSIHCYIESGLNYSYRCESGYYLQPTTPTTCESSCPLYSYIEEIPVPKCIRYPPNCITFDSFICHECDNGYYLISNPRDINSSCQPCSENCAICDYINDNVKCISCNIGYYYQPEGEVLECDIVCPEGYYIDEEDNTCKKCTTGYYAYNTDCITCKSLCIICKSLDKCTDCIQGAYLSNNECICKSNYLFSDGECIELFMNPTFEISDNKLIISFDEPLIKALESSDLNLTIDRVTYYSHQFSINSSSNLQSFELQSKTFSIQSSTDFIIIFSDASKILDISLHKLEKDIYYYTNLYPIKLEPEEDSDNNPESDNEENSNITEEFKSSGIAIALGVFITCTILCMIKLNLNALWCIFNTIQIYPYIPLLNINIPPRTLGIYQAFSSLNIMVNFFSYFIEESGPATTGKVEEAGYNTGQILLNSGQSLSMLSILIVIYLIVLIFSKILKGEEDSCTGKYVKKLINRMQWNSFLRFFIEAYLDLTIGSFLNLIYCSVSSIHGDIELSISLVISLLTFLMPLFILYLILKSSEQLSQENFETKCSSLYDEYGKDIHKVLYNIIFLIRRYVFAVCLIFLGSSPYIQLAINSIIAYLPFIYIIRFKPFSTKSDNILNGITEGCIFIKMTLLFVLLEDMSKDREFYFDWALVICLYASFLIPLAYRVLSIGMNLLNKIRGIKSTTIEPRTENIITDETNQNVSSKDVLR